VFPDRSGLTIKCGDFYELLPIPLLSAQQLFNVMNPCDWKIQAQLRESLVRVNQPMGEQLEMS
jgi:hypothetical protein